MSAPFSSSSCAPVPSSDPLEAGAGSDLPYSPPPEASPSYPGGPSDSSARDAKTSCIRPDFPIENDPQSQLAFYRDELNIMRRENQKLWDRIEKMEEEESARSKKPAASTLSSDTMWAIVTGAALLTFVVTWVLGR